MNIFIAGGSGAIGRELMPLLIGAGHQVTAMTRSPDRASKLMAAGCEAVICDVFDGPHLSQLVAAAQPEIVIHQLTAFGATEGDPAAETIRVRTEGTRNLVAAAQASGARRFIAQSISFFCTPHVEGLTDENTPLYVDGPPAVRPTAEAVASLESQTLQANGIEGVVLRYGWFYGPGTNYDPGDVIPAAIRKGRRPIVGDGSGTFSFVHVRDAAAATMQALTLAAPGIYNIVDDDPAPVGEWLPFAAKLLNAPSPPHMEESVARERLGDLAMYVLSEQRGASNAKARSQLNWRPLIASWRTGFTELYSPRD